jgi:hypothetical protein
MFTVIHELGELRPAGAKLIGDMPPGLDGVFAVGLIKRLPDRSGDHGVLSLRHMRERVADPVNPAALPGRFKDPRDRRLEAAVRVTDDQLDPVKTARPQ